MGKYFKKKVNNSNDSIKKLLLITVGVVLLIIIIALLVKVKKPKINKPNAIIEVKEEVSLKLHSDLPKDELFEKYENVEDGLIKIDYNGLNTDQLGEYEVYVINTKSGQQISVLVKIVDTTPPELTLREFTIEEGQSYLSTDFIEDCTDDGGECFIEFSNPEKDGSYTIPGTYEVIIKAIDDANNETIKQTKLIIVEKPPVCEFGENIVSDEDKEIPIAYSTIDNENKCAVNDRIIFDKEIHDKLEKMLTDDLVIIEPKVHDYCTKNKIDCYVTADTDIVYIYSADEKINNDKLGVVGAAIKVDIYVNSDINESVKKNKSDLKISYYIKEDGTRQYIKNEFNIK